MGVIRNTLFVIFDHLRHDQLSSAGHPELKAPTFDGLGEMDTRVSRDYVKSPICSASWMSFCTDRHGHSHNAAWSIFPLKPGETTLGDHRCPLDV